jgi:hypothetical protein
MANQEELSIVCSEEKIYALNPFLFIGLFNEAVSS